MISIWVWLGISLKLLLKYESYKYGIHINGVYRNIPDLIYLLQAARSIYLTYCQMWFK